MTARRKQRVVARSRVRIADVIIISIIATVIADVASVTVYPRKDNEATDFLDIFIAAARVAEKDENTVIKKSISVYVCTELAW